MKPEKIVEKQVMAMAKQIGLDLSVVESKAKYSKALGIYRQSETESGYSDISGNTPDGIAVFVELKAPGKIRNLSPQQRSFLLRKIEAGCFACCVDSPDLLFQNYLGWKQQGREFLLRALPEVRVRRPKES